MITKQDLKWKRSWLVRQINTSIFWRWIESKLDGTHKTMFMIGSCVVHIREEKVTKEKKQIELLGLIDLYLQNATKTQITSKQSKSNVGSPAQIQCMVSREAFSQYSLLLQSKACLKSLLTPSYEQHYLRSIRWCSNLTASYDSKQPFFYLYIPE